MLAWPVRAGTLAQFLLAPRESGRGGDAAPVGALQGQPGAPAARELVEANSSRAADCSSSGRSAAGSTDWAKSAQGARRSCTTRCADSRSRSNCHFTSAPPANANSASTATNAR
jgi:hypothetical protein